MKAACKYLTSLVIACAAVASLHAQVAGTVESGFNPNLNNYVDAIAVQPDGKILVGGNFTMAGTTPRNYIARLYTDGSLDTTFDPGTGPNAGVQSIAVQPDGKILIMGAFISVNGIGPHDYVARLNADGSVESKATFNITSGPDDQVFCMALQPDGKILLGGLSQTPTNHLLRLNPDGSRDGTFSTSFNSYVSSVAVQPDGRILVSSADGFFRLSSTGVRETSPTFAANAIVGVADSILVQSDGKILVGGNINGPTPSIDRLNSDGTPDAGFNPGTGASGAVTSITRQADGKIIIAGDFGLVNGQPRAHVARLDATGAVESTNTFNVGTTIGAVIAMQPDGKILLGGGFSQVNGQNYTGLVRLGNDLATQNLATPDATHLNWLRGGAAVDINQAFFELSTDGGAHWSSLGSATSVAGGWQRTGLSLPVSGLVRARAPIMGGVIESSTGLIESVAAIDYTTQQPVLLAPASGTKASHALAVSYALPENALAGSVTLNFSGPVIQRVFPLAAGGESAGQHDFTFDPKNPTASSAIASGLAIPDGAYQVTIAYQDPLGNPKAASVAATNVRVDTGAPTLTLPSSFSVEAQNAAGAPVTFTVTASDTADPNPSVTAIPATGSVFPIGTTTVNVTATDWAGNTHTGKFLVKVRDSIAPTVGGSFSPLTLATGPTGTVALPDYAPQAVTADAVGVVSVVQDPPAGSGQPAGTTTVTISAMDAAGNTGTTAFNVVVTDGTAPSITAPAAGFTPSILAAGPNGTAPLPDYTAQAVTADNVGVTGVAQDPLPGTAFPTGVVPITLTAHDAAGNTNTVIFNIMVVDVTAPTIATPAVGFAPLQITTGADGAVALPDYTAQAVVADNVAVTGVSQAPLPGSLRPAGITTVTLTAQDAAGNTANLSFDVTVADGTKPEISAPSVGFSPLDVTAGPDGTAALGDYTGQAVTSDNVAVTSVTQAPLPGDFRLFGRTTVTLTAHDAAGNTRSISFDVVVHLAASVVDALGSVGGDVPGAGLDPRVPAGSKFSKLGIPAVADNRALAFLGKWTVPTGVDCGVFTGTTPALLVKLGDDAPGIAGAQFASLQDPLIAPDGAVAFRATVRGAGITPGNAEGVWLSSEGVPTLVLREGAPITGLASNLRLKSIAGLSLRDGALLALARLAPTSGSVTTANDSVLLRVTMAGATMLIREGDLLDLGDGVPASTIQSIKALVPAVGSPGQGRWQGNDTAAAQVMLANQRSVILDLAADGTVRRSLAVGDGVPGLPSSVIWNTLNIPAMEPGGQGAVVRGTLVAFIFPGTPPAVKPQNDSVLAYSPDPGSAFSVFAREGTPAPGAGTATFLSFFNPLVNDAGRVAFLGRLAGTGVSTANDTGIWWGAPGALTLLVRASGAVPDPDGVPTNTRWTRFISLALPSGPDGGPIFMAQIHGSGISAKNDRGIWGIDSSGLLRQLLRTGDLVNGQPVVSIQALTGVPAAQGASRGFNERGTVAARVTFATGGQAIVRVDIPDGRTRLVTSLGN